MLISSRVMVRICLRCSVWMVSSYAHEFILLTVVNVTLPPITQHVLNALAKIAI